MGLDTRQKRASALSWLMLLVPSSPAPDGTLDQGDRQHIGFSYAGILAGAPPAPAPAPSLPEFRSPVRLAQMYGLQVRR